MMNLHLDKDAFSVIIENIHKRTGYRTDVLEKDYYVVLILQELSKAQSEGLPAYFKGGTALYKALKTTNRFSEDIDLSVDTRGCNNSQNKKRLKDSTKKFSSLKRDESFEESNRFMVTTLYNYSPITNYDKDDTLQRFGKLKIEATSFTISEPIEDLEVSPIIYELATEEEKQILSTQFKVFPFKIKTISLERVFIDKIFAAEAYVRRAEKKNRAFEAAKHIYDLSVIYNHPKITHLLNNEDDLKQIIDIRMQEEENRLDGIFGVSLSDFSFFSDVEFNQKVRSAYEIMQDQYVLRQQDRIPFTVAVNRLKQIEENLKSNSAWFNYDVNTSLTR